MNEQEKARLEELERKDAAWSEKRRSLIRIGEAENSKKRKRLVYEGLTPEEMDECHRLSLKRYWEWVLTDSPDEDARLVAFHGPTLLLVSQQAA